MRCPASREQGRGGGGGGPGLRAARVSVANRSRTAAVAAASLRSLTFWRTSITLISCSCRSAATRRRCHTNGRSSVIWMTNRSTQQGATHMSERIDRAAAAPPWVTFFGPIAKVLVAAGIPLGPNALVTIRGRKSGRPRTTPLAIIEVAGRRWVLAPWGDGQWG